MIRVEHSQYPVAANSHAGMSGKNNEDRFAVSAYRLSKRSDMPSLLAVLCDGIGGHRAGEVAAEMAVNIISQAIAESDGSHPTETMEKAIHRANQAVYEAASKDNGKSGMGATVACVWLIGNRLYSATVGDSRIYLIRGDRIRQISIDHTWIQEALDRNLIQPSEVANHPNRHVIRRYLGGSVPPQVDFRLVLNNGESDEQAQANQGTRLQTGDRLLLCSDGLTDLVSDSEIQAAFDQQEDAEAVESLIDLANKRGGHDNITIITTSMPGKVVNYKPKKRSILPFGCAFAAILAGVVIALVLAYFIWSGFPGLGLLRGSSTPPVRTIDALITSAPQATATGQQSLPTASETPFITATFTPEATQPLEVQGSYPYPPAETQATTNNSDGYP